jgi:hypothetical protein
MNTRTLLPLAALLALPALARAESLATEARYTLQPAPAATKKAPLYAAENTDWLTFGGGISHDFSGNGGYDLTAAWSRFVIDRFELSAEVAFWYFAQNGDNAFGVNPQFVMRYHFYRSEDARWTIFAEAGIGLLFSTDNVPSGGTSFNFTPRAGVGFTRQLTDSGLRLQVGLRWAHISNARLNSDSRNPSRDSAMLYAGLIFPY